MSERELASQHGVRGRRRVDCIAAWESGERAGTRESTQRELKKQFFVPPFYFARRALGLLKRLNDLRFRTHICLSIYVSEFAIWFVGFAA